MKNTAIAIFDIGKTNKKFFIFDSSWNILHEEEQRFEETTDDEGFACDDVDRIASWMKERLSKAIKEIPEINSVNFTTYGASLAYLDADGNRIAPVYNYLKDMPEDVMNGFYESNGGMEEFCRQTASPALGMLNSGLQIRWLKRKKPHVFSKVATILHFPQYLSYLFTQKTLSEYTSIGCHTAMWDYDHNHYHPWLQKEGIHLPEPVSNKHTVNIHFQGHPLKVGVGIHDSSASLIPYFCATDDKFILISTGTWFIFMNPFNEEPLTSEQLKKDTLCYLSVKQKQVKSSRLFLGYQHDAYLKELNGYFNTPTNHYKEIQPNNDLINKMFRENKQVFFKENTPDEVVNFTPGLHHFRSFEETYHQLMYDLVDRSMEALSLVSTPSDGTNKLFISGGFAHNKLFIKLLTLHMPEKEIQASDFNNATALGAAMIL